MQKNIFKLLFVVIGVAIVGVIGWTIADKRTNTDTISGTLTDVATEENTFSLWKATSTTRTKVKLTDQTVIETSEEKVPANYLRDGFRVRVDIIPGGEDKPHVARWITITEEPPVLVQAPLPNQSVASPLEVQGNARGPWYFESSFPVRLQNNSGEVIAETQAKAQGDWMQEGYVPFSAQLDFSNADDIGKTGEIVFEKANPSGLDSNAQEYKTPISFAGTSTVQVFFGKDIVGTDIIDCSAVFPTERTIAQTQAVARAALTELLAGPTQQEVRDRFITNIPDGVSIQQLEIRNGTANVDFNQALQQDVGGSCRVQAIRAQITQTLKQFDSVNDVQISINGETETILQP